MSIPPVHASCTVSWYTPAAAAAAKKNKMGTERLLRDMPRNGVQPDMQTYTAAISVLSSAFQPKEAFCLMREMSEQGLAPRGSSGASACFAGIVEVYGRDPARAAELAALARTGTENGPDFFAYSAAIAVCAAATSSATTASLPTNSPHPSPAENAGGREGWGEAGVWRRDDIEAPRLLREMMVAGLAPDEACFTNALSACRDLRQGKEALAILREMEAAGVNLDGIVYTLVSYFSLSAATEAAVFLSALAPLPPRSSARALFLLVTGPPQPPRRFDNPCGGQPEVINKHMEGAKVWIGGLASC